MYNQVHMHTYNISYVSLRTLLYL